MITNLYFITSAEFVSCSDPIVAASFQDTAVNNGTLSASNAVSFTGSSVNNGTLSASNAVYFTGSSVNNGIVDSQGSLSFSGAAVNVGEVAGSVVVFDESSTNTGVVLTSAAFVGASSNSGSVSGSAEFSLLAANNGSIAGTAVFNPGTSNTGTLFGNAVFLPYSSNTGNVIGEAFIAENVSNTGTLAVTSAYILSETETQNLSAVIEQTSIFQNWLVTVGDGHYNNYGYDVWAYNHVVVGTTEAAYWAAVEASCPAEGWCSGMNKWYYNGHLASGWLNLADSNGYQYYINGVATQLDQNGDCFYQTSYGGAQFGGFYYSPSGIDSLFYLNGIPYTGDISCLWDQETYGGTVQHGVSVSFTNGVCTNVNIS